MNLLNPVLLTLSLGGATLPALVVPVEPDLRQQIDTILAQTQPHPFSGGVLLMQAGVPLYSRAQGQTGQLAPTLRSQYIIGSVSKQITASLVLREVAAKRLALDAPVSRYLPELKHPWATQVTVRQLLNHTSGLDDLAGPLRNPPGSSFAYWNGGYVLLGKLVEHSSHKPYASLAASLFRQCGMSHTSAPANGSLASLQQRYPLLAMGYTEAADGRIDQEGGERLAENNPAGGLISTLDDLARWNQCLHEGDAVSPPLYQAMLTPATSAHREHRWGRLDYGYGLQLDRQDGLQEISHSGYVNGYISTLLYYPTQHFSVVIQENTAWQASDPERGFYLHDQIRAAVRRYLINHPTQLSSVL